MDLGEALRRAEEQHAQAHPCFGLDPREVEHRRQLAQREPSVVLKVVDLVAALREVVARSA